MKKNRKQFIALAVLIVLAVGLFLVWNALRPEPQAGEKSIRVTVVHADGSERAFDVTTRAETLGALLREEGIASGEEGEYGLYIHAADGEADNEALQQWWCITKGGETVVTGADDIMLSDGDAYELTLKTGW